MDTKDSAVWRIQEVIPETHDVTSLVIAGPEGATGVRERHPGQFAIIRVKTDDGWGEPHPFTISCETGCDSLRFTIKSAGDFTSTIRELKPGTEIRCDGPFGKFCSDIEDKDNIVMIAGGVGVTPFLSVLRTFRQSQATNRMLLLWSNKTLTDAFARDELEQISQELDLRVIHTLTREEPPEQTDTDRIMYRAGRIDGELIAVHAQLNTAAFYICGPPAMQDAIKEQLARFGVAGEAIQTESFGG